MGVVDAIRRDRHWKGPRLALGCFGGVLVLAGVGLAAAVGPAPLSKAIGAIAAAVFGYGIVRYNREGVTTTLQMLGLSPTGWYAMLNRGLWIVCGVILICASPALAVEAVKSL